MQHWPRLSRARLGRDNLLCTRQCGLPLTGASGELRLRVLADAVPPAVILSVRLSSAEGSAWLGLGEGMLAVLAGDSLGGQVDIQGLPKALLAALLDVGLERFLGSAGALLGTDIRQERLISGQPSALPGEYLVFELAGVVGVLWYEAGLTPTLMSLLQHLPPREPHDLQQLPLVVAVLAGRSWLMLEDLKQLNPEDVLLLEEQPPGEQRLWLRVGNRLLAVAAFEAGRVAITERLENSMSEEVQQEAQDTPPIAVEALPVELTFEVGRLQLSIGELQRLQVGQSFALERDPSRPVTVRANGQRIATGELVQIDQTLGVRILELHLRHG